jgi:single-stranded DNA-binding protein
MMHLFAAGELVRDPERKTAKNGNAYATALMREGEAVITVTAFDRELAERLLTLEKGDPLAVAGRLTVSAYLDKQEEPKAGLQVTATRLMAAPARMSSAHETP